MREFLIIPIRMISNCLLRINRIGFELAFACQTVSGKVRVTQHGRYIFDNSTYKHFTLDFTERSIFLTMQSAIIDAKMEEKTSFAIKLLDILSQTSRSILAATSLLQVKDRGTFHCAMEPWLTNGRGATCKHLRGNTTS